MSKARVNQFLVPFLYFAMFHVMKPVVIIHRIAPKNISYLTDDDMSKHTALRDRFGISLYIYRVGDSNVQKKYEELTFSDDLMF